MAASKWIRTPKGYVAIAMILFLFTAAVWSKDARGVSNAIIAVVISLAVDVFCSRIARRKRTLPDGAAITGLLIALILSTTTSWYIVAATSILAVLSKHVLVYKKKPIFNPAAFGLLLSILLFRTGESWWGAFGDLPAWTVAFLLIAGYSVTNRVNKFPQVLSYLGTYVVLLFLMGVGHVGDAYDALRPPFINASLFLALFMLTDPPTSPAKEKDQVVFGILSAAVGAAVYALYGGLIYLFVGLLVGNLYHVWKKASLPASKLQKSSA